MNTIVPKILFLCQKNKNGPNKPTVSQICSLQSPARIANTKKSTYLFLMKKIKGCQEECRRKGYRVKIIEICPFYARIDQIDKSEDERKMFIFKHFFRKEIHKKTSRREYDCLDQKQVAGIRP